MCCWCCGWLSFCTGSSYPVEVEAEVTGEFQLHVHPLSSSALQVSWGEPLGTYGLYKIRYRCAVKKKHRWSIIKPNHGWSAVKSNHGSHQCQITGLKPDTSYEIQIKNKSIPKQQQEYSPSVFGQTLRGTEADMSRAAEKTRLLS